MSESFLVLMRNTVIIIIIKPTPSIQLNGVCSQTRPRIAAVRGSSEPIILP